MTIYNVLIPAVVFGLAALVTYLWSCQGGAGYDFEGNLRYLSTRDPNRHDWLTADGQPVPPHIVDETLVALCESFDVPVRQKDLLRPDDTLEAIYRHILGPRFWDDLQFERLAWKLKGMIGRPVSADDWRTIPTVGDLVRFVTAHRPTGSATSVTTPLVS